MDIFYTVDNNYVPQLATNICSVCRNHPHGEDILFHILSKGISEENQLHLTDFVRGFNQNVKFYNISNFMDTLGFEFDTAGWNEIVLARLLMSDFLPSSLSRVIYLDADTLVLDDLVRLWDQDLAGKTVGMVCEPTADRSRRERLGIGGYNYHNAGVLLVDLDRWRSTSCQERILRYCSANAEALFANDQDALNVVLRDEIKTLGPEFDYSNIFDYYNYEFLNALMPGFATKTEFNAARQHPVIVHYLGEERPWRQGNTHRFDSEYHTYLGQTPWHDAKYEEGWELYFAAWRAFNFVTKPFPSVRYRIINSLIPAFMRLRAKKRKSA